MSKHLPHRLLPIPMPDGGLQTNEQEADWLTKTITMRVNETLENAGLKGASFAAGNMQELLLLSLDAASRRGTRGERKKITDWCFQKEIRHAEGGTGMTMDQNSGAVEALNQVGVYLKQLSEADAAAQKPTQGAKP